ncbi:hypothetical protein BLNAU_18539 [Blattamonas nauphoetae]|uniref:Uncharacterized protein n=1 Tax=Blattamonas nauphoetae TaxID=2049346 RepID=A0ABQ9X6G3_9EUKA|nr:hypothetical protein BLNAU_18539 [Blattamonas nauphoetae]
MYSHHINGSYPARFPPRHSPPGARSAIQTQHTPYETASKLAIMLKVVNVADSSIRGKNVYTQDPVVDWVNHVFNMTEVRNSECTEPRGID